MNSEGGMGDNLTCNTCGKQLSSQASLLEHQRTHTGERPHSCNVCEKRFTQRAHLIIHKRTHTGEKPYACHICNKRFAQSSHLNGHKRIHTGEKPYSCSICNMGFCRKQRLEVHIKQHATEAEGSTWHSLDDPICESKIGLVSQVTPLNDLDGGDQGELSPLVSHTRRRKPSVVRKLNTETAMNVVKTELDEFDAESDGLTSGQSDWLDMTLQSLQTAKSPVSDVTNQPVFPSTHPPYSFKTDTNSDTISIQPKLSVKTDDTDNVSVTSDSNHSSSDIGIPSQALKQSLLSHASLKQSRSFRSSTRSNIDVQRLIRTNSRISLVEFSADDLIRHLMSRDDIFRCDFCCTIFQDAAMYHLHRSMHDKMDCRCCNICGKLLKDKYDFTAHFLSEHKL